VIATRSRTVPDGTVRNASPLPVRQDGAGGQANRAAPLRHHLAGQRPAAAAQQPHRHGDQQHGQADREGDPEPAHGVAEELAGGRAGEQAEEQVRLQEHTAPQDQCGQRPCRVKPGTGRGDHGDRPQAWRAAADGERRPAAALEQGGSPVEPAAGQPHPGAGAGSGLITSLPAILLIAFVAGRLLGVRRSLATTLLSGLAGWIAGTGLSLVIADGDPGAPGFGRNVWVFSIVFTMSAAVWVELLAISACSALPR
jgi:hypothetical protein